MAILMGRWDCSSCGTKMILGDQMNCTGCGKRRAQDVEFYLPENAKEITDKKDLAEALAGPDWSCEYCNTTNPASVKNCPQCGVERGTSKDRKAIDYAEEEIPRSQEGLKPRTPEQDYDDYCPTAGPGPLNHRFIFKVGLGLLGLIILLAWILTPRHASVTVQEFLWQRTVQIEVIRTVTESDWAIPSGGRYVSQNQEIHHYDQVLDHYEQRTRQLSRQVSAGTTSYSYPCGSRSLGNGRFASKTCTGTKTNYRTEYYTESYSDPVYRSVPRYATKYTYNVERWFNDRVAEASGNFETPHWPIFALNPKQREGQRQEIYSVQLLDKKGKSYSYVTTEDRWHKFSSGKSYDAKINLAGQISIPEIEEP